MTTDFYATIARYYDSEHHDKDEDFDFYEQIADETVSGRGPGSRAKTKRGGTIAIIGSGTGRLAMRLAERGHTVHGIEIERAMLDRAEAKLNAAPALRERLHYHHADALSFSPPEPCDIAIIPYNTLMHFIEPEQQVRLLTRIHSALVQDGVLIIDLPNAGDAFAAQDTESVVLERMFSDLETGHLVMQQSSSRLDRVEQIMSVTWIYDEVGEGNMLKRTVVPVEIRYFFYHELRLLLRQCGFELEVAFGDFDGSVFSDGAPRMVVIARAKRSAGNQT